MNHNNDKDAWDWQSYDYCLEDNASIEVTGKEVVRSAEPYSQVKRRLMLQFESEVLDAPPYNDDSVLRSKETRDSLEDDISDRVAGFAEGTPGSSNKWLDPSSEGWIGNCINDAEKHFDNEDISCASGASDVQIDMAALCNIPPEYDANAVPKDHVQTLRSVAFRGTPPKQASSVVYPFAFIKPCGVHGDMTLKDINKRIHTPRDSMKDEDPSICYPTSAFSGKPVVGKTKTQTEGGKGSITIMRTKG